MAKTRSNAKSKIAILGAGGRLGAALVREYSPRHEVTGFTHADLDLADLDKLRSTLSSLKFDVLFNAAALTNVDYCENHRDEALHLNAEAPRVLAEICHQQNARFIHISTDYVFDGEKRAPYVEEDAAEPISAYGESKREGERRVAEANDHALIVRVSWVFGPDRPSFIDALLKKAREEETVVAVADKFSTPTYTHDVATLLGPLLDKENAGNGLLHLANRGECSWQGYAQWALDCCHREGVKMKARTVGATSLAAMTHFVARRPVYTVLATEKYERITNQAPRDWHDAVAEYIREYYGRQP
ncbi:MAG TPA: dTDP-4-dehydrorhamnose reductase [Chthoniobacterales bacterium]|jgi:dTDP-4-dehydrorhamnose reductase